jgi:hypothetical protein
VTWTPLTDLKQFSVRCQNVRCPAYTGVSVLGSDAEDAVNCWNGSLELAETLIPGKNERMTVQVNWDAEKLSLNLGRRLSSLTFFYADAVTLRDKLEEWLSKIADKPVPGKTNLRVLAFSKPAEKVEEKPADEKTEEEGGDPDGQGT